jgi:hypothetical protein
MAIKMFVLSDVLSVIISLIVFAWLGTLSFLLFRLLQTFAKLTKGVEGEDLKSILDEILSSTKQNRVADAELNQKLLEMKSEALKGVQKVGLVRYNPFADTGGNQSFALALLDGKNSGFVITSLHSRESTRVFAKPVVQGKESEYEFSKEEKEAIAEAQKCISR